MWKLLLLIVLALVVLYYVKGNMAEGWLIAPDVSDYLARKQMIPHLVPSGPIVLSSPLPGDLKVGEVVKCAATGIKYYLDSAGVKRRFDSPAALLSVGSKSIREVSCDLLNQVPTGPNVPDPTVGMNSRNTIRV
jgi:hypothetical protein